MGWLGDLWERIKGREHVDMVFVPLPAGTVEEGTFEDDECYVELFIDSLRLRNARRSGSNLDGVVYTFVSLPREGESKTVVPAISKPDNLAKLDPGGLSRVIAVNKQMMGAMPWRGGPLSLELGLFSVKGDDLLTPVLNFVTDVSSAAGVAFVGRIAPFVPLITQGMDMLARQSKDVALEVGLDTAIELRRPGTYAVIAVPKAGLTAHDRIALDPADRKLLIDGQPLQEGYCVFSLRRTEKKADYGEIPELKDRFAAIIAAIRSGEEEDARAALTAFRWAAIASPDLITKDATRLVAKAKAKVDAAFQSANGAGPATASMGSGGRQSTGRVDRLADLDLYGAH